MADETIDIGGDLSVRRLGFGAMRLTDWGPPRDRPAAIAVARRAVELGVTLVDTADAYALGANEELLAEALHPYPSGLVIATKAGQSRPGRDRWKPLGRPEYLIQQAELSLRRLRLERIELFQLHRVDPQVPFAEQLGALKQLRDDGKIRHIGLSEVGVAQLEEARRTVPIASVQNLYNLADRRHEDVLDYCEAAGIAFIPWFPVAGGAHALAGGPLAQVAQQIGGTPAQVALAWLLARSPVTLPIPGTSSVVHLEENMAAMDIRLTGEQFGRLDAVWREAQSLEPAG
ncbi:aldo/keto reductase [Nonomuraea angiospora]|uniref:aldo/keto reductase n=1 Tax=Nonomuraea angiospora TaxID=46172 RepID=UPI003330AD7C